MVDPKDLRNGHNYYQVIDLDIYGFHFDIFHIKIISISEIEQDLCFGEIWLCDNDWNFICFAHSVDLPRLFTSFKDAMLFREKLIKQNEIRDIIE